MTKSSKYAFLRQIVVRHQSKYFSVTAMEGGNNNVIQLQGQGGNVPVLQQPLENTADLQHLLENTAVGQVGAGYGALPQNHLILESPPVLQSNAEMIMAFAAGRMFSIEAANQFLNLSAAHQNQFTACFIKKMLQDEAIKKAQEEASFKQKKLTKTNLR